MRPQTTRVLSMLWVELRLPSVFMDAGHAPFPIVQGLAQRDSVQHQRWRRATRKRAAGRLMLVDDCSHLPNVKVCIKPSLKFDTNVLIMYEQNALVRVSFSSPPMGV